MKNLAQCFGFSHPKKPPPLTIVELCRRFILEEIQKSTNNFDPSQVIGRGGFGTVTRYKDSINGGTDYTVPIWRGNANSFHDRSVFKNKIQLLCQLRHPNLISVVGV